MNFPVIYPFDGKTLLTYPGHTPAEVEEKLVHVVRAQKQWKEWSFSERKRIMVKAASILLRKKKKYSTLISEEMGKPITQSEAEIEKSAWACEHFAEHAEKYLQPMNVRTEAKKSYVSFEPLGVILGIMPWNFPFWQVFRFAAPTLMAGNGIVLKHASNVPGSSLAIQEVFHEAGVPTGLFASLLIDSKTALVLIDDPRIAGVSVTGSTQAGKQIASRAGLNVKKCVLELGGSDPFVVLNPVESVQDCAHSAVQGRMVNGGQSCIAAKRFIVPKNISPEFAREMKKAMSELKVGDPMEPSTQVGPLARKDLVEHLRGQVSRSVRLGAHVLFKHPHTPKKGFFYAPTLLSRIRTDMPVFSEETFGPVAGIISADSPMHAVELANLSEYGLGSSIWSSDVKKAESFARRIRAGNVFVNKNVASDPRIAFGGTKQSGLGKELGELGIKEFVNAKTIWIN